jgi:hypothetical protein
MVLSGNASLSDFRYRFHYIKGHYEIISVCDRRMPAETSLYPHTRSLSIGLKQRLKYS